MNHDTTAQGEIPIWSISRKQHKLIDKLYWEASKQPTLRVVYWHCSKEECFKDNTQKADILLVATLDSTLLQFMLSFENKPTKNKT